VPAIRRERGQLLSMTPAVPPRWAGVASVDRVQLPDALWQGDTMGGTVDLGRWLTPDAGGRVFRILFGAAECCGQRPQRACDLLWPRPDSRAPEHEPTTMPDPTVTLAHTVQYTVCMYVCIPGKLRGVDRTYYIPLRRAVFGKTARAHSLILEPILNSILVDVHELCSRRP
jgi:hypothetical protein